MMQHVLRNITITVLVATLAACGGDERVATESADGDSSPPAGLTMVSHISAPFEYDLVSTQESIYAGQPLVTIVLETTNDVAKKATEADLRRVWRRIVSRIDDQYIVHIKLRTPVPGAPYWAEISRNRVDNAWKVSIAINSLGIDADPFRFVSKIDRSVKTQQNMIVPLSMVDRLSEQFLQRGWKVDSRRQDFFKTDAHDGVTVTLDPTHVDVHGYMPKGNAFYESVELVFAELGIADELMVKLEAVLGDSDGNPDASRTSHWVWEIGEIKLLFIGDQKSCNLSATYATMK